jgi:hypothetical protein
MNGLREGNSSNYPFEIDIDSNGITSQGSQGEHDANQGEGDEERKENGFSGTKESEDKEKEKGGGLWSALFG